MTGMFALFVSALGLVGCPGPPGPLIDPRVDVVAPQDEFSAPTRALEAALEAEDVAAAHLAFATLEGLADPMDATKTAEIALYRGRLARLEGDVESALGAFTMANSADAEPPVAAAARVYVALIGAERAPSRDALRGLEALPGNPQALLGARDRGPGWTLVAEARLRNEDPEGALDAFALAYSGADGVNDETLSAFIVVRAFAAAGALEPDSRALVFASAQGLARAAAGYELVRAQAADPASAGVEALLPAVMGALSEVGAADRVAELEHLTRQPGGHEAQVIGAVLPLTGPSRRVGRRTMAGILQGVGAFFPGGGQRLTVVFKDTASTPEAARRAVEELDALGVVAILGPLGVDETIAAARAAKERGIPLLSFAVDDAVLETGALRFGQDARAEAELAARTALERGLTKAIILRPENPFGEELAVAFQDAFVNGAGTIVETYTYAPDAVDHRKMAERASARSFDVVFIPDTGDAAALVARFMAQQNIWTASPEKTLAAAALAAQPKAKKKGAARRFVTYLGPGSWYAPDLHAKVGAYLEGAIFIANYLPEREDKANTFFVDTFQHLYGREPGVYEAVAFDATRLVRELVMARRLTVRAQLADGLAATSERAGVTGTFGFVDGVARPTAWPMSITAQDVRELSPIEPPALEMPPIPEGGATEPVPDESTPHTLDLAR